MKLKKTKLILTVLIAFIVTGAAIWGVMVFQNKSNAIAVKVFSVREGDISSDVPATGNVEEMGRRNISISSAARVEKIPVKLGSEVKKGDILAVLDTEKLKSQFEQLKISYESEKISLESLKSSNNLKETAQAEAAVKQAELDVKQAEASIERKESDIAQKKTELERNKKLMEAGALPKADWERLQKDYENALRDLDKLRDDRQSYGLKLNTAVRSLDKLKLDNNQLEMDKKTQIETQENKAKLAEIKLRDMEQDLKDVNLTNGNLLSPVDGVVSFSSLKEGEYTKSGDPFIKINTSKELKITAKVNESDIKDIRFGNTVRISGIGFSGTINGTVSAIAPTAHKERIDNAEMTVVDVDVTVKDEKGILKPGYNVDLKINTINKKGVMVVHKDAVKDEKGGKRYVYTVEGNGVKKKTVETASASDSLIEVTSGLMLGEKVIYNAKGSLSEAAKIKILDQQSK